MKSAVHCSLVSSGEVTVCPIVRADSKISWSFPPAKVWAWANMAVQQGSPEHAAGGRGTAGGRREAGSAGSMGCALSCHDAGRGGRGGCAAPCRQRSVQSRTARRTADKRSCPSPLGRRPAQAPGHAWSLVARTACQARSQQPGRGKVIKGRLLQPEGRVVAQGRCQACTCACVRVSVVVCICVHGRRRSGRRWRRSASGPAPGTRP